MAMMLSLYKLITKHSVMNKKLTHAILIGGAALASAFGVVNGFQALNLSYMDTTMVPGNDFYTYVNGKWM